LVQFVANSGNELLKDHLLSAPKNATYLGKDAQNEMITILGSAGRDEVVTRVRKAQKYVVMMDETRDLSNTDQVSIFVRFVNFDAEVPLIEERMLGLVETEGKTGEILEGLLIGVLEQNNLDLADVVGQCQSIKGCKPVF